MKCTSWLRRSSLATATWHLSLLRGCESGLELRAAVERIRALAGLYLDELTDQLQALSVGELMKGLPLSLDPEPRAALLRRGNPDVRDNLPVRHCSMSLYKSL